MLDNISILIVEDSLTQSTKIKIFLEESGYKVSVCHDGEEAWDFMQHQEIPPSLVISDIMMPKMDGYDLCEKIRQNEKFNDVMVMLLTVLSEPTDIIKGLRSQADSFLIKPYNKNFLLTRIGHLLEYRNFIKEMPRDMGLAIDYFGQRHFLTSNRVQVINDLLTVHDTVETQKNKLERALEAERKLKESQERLALVLEGSNLGYWDWNLETGEVKRNERWAEMLGYTLSEIEFNVKQWTDLHHPDDRAAAWKSIQDHLEGRTEMHKIEYRMLAKDGQYKWILDCARIVKRDEQGRPLRMSGTHTDINDRKRAENALKESEKKYRQIYDNLLDAYYEASIDGIILEISPSIENFSKYKRKELIGKSLYQLYTNPDERDELVKKIIRDGCVNEYELNLTDKDGAQLICSINTMIVKDDKGEPHKLVGVVRDISERKRVEKEKKELKERLVRSQKMESLGLLAGGVAHDLNNVLSGIVSYPDLLLMDLPEDSPLRKPILTIQKSGQKAAAIVQDLLTLARRGVNISEVLNLNDIILDYLKSPEYYKLLNYYPDLSIETNFENSLLNIKGSPIHLKKIIMNLVSNAAEAQPSCGKIAISTYNRYIDVPLRGYEEIREGDYVVLEVTDNGIGISDEDLSRIFEPFYSKKMMGRSGTGLGMAVVWGSIQDHNGYINIESTKGEGTTFYLYFPVTREKLAKEKDVIPIEAYMGNKESILVVDDIEEQRELATNLLSRLNYSVSAVSSGEAALEYLKTNTADLLLLDMIMDPGIDGLDTFKKIIACHPQQKAVIASGFSETDRVKEAQKIGVGQYIKKPYTLEKIGISVKEELKK